MRKFEINIKDDKLKSLKKRLLNSVFPDEINNSWTYGTNLSYVKDFLKYWVDEYDWEIHQRKINSYEHFKTTIDDLDLHFLYVKGKGKNPLPLLLCHGWPGSFFEFYKVIPMLTDPIKFDCDAYDSFSLVIPSLPGFGYSYKANQKRYSVKDIVPIFKKLMTETLGFKKFCIQGGDWGSFIASRFACDYPELLFGLHLNMMPIRRDKNYFIELDKNFEVKKYISELDIFIKEEMGYQWIQGTRPQTLSYGLIDSPVALASWILEKFYLWTDCNGDIDKYLGKDDLITNIMIYWDTGCIGSSFWPYYSRIHEGWPIELDKTIEVPTAYIEFPKEILRPPRILAEKVYSNITNWETADVGGHFAALEQPAILTKSIRDFFKKFR